MPAHEKRSKRARKIEATKRMVKLGHEFGPRARWKDVWSGTASRRLCSHCGFEVYIKKSATMGGYRVASETDMPLEECV